MSMLRKKIGERLKEERIRLGYNQLQFSAIGGSSKGTQLAWEQGKQSPNAEFLALVAEVGVDVQYVLLGTTAEVTVPEVELIQKYRGLDAACKVRIMGIIEGMLSVSDLTNPS